MTPEEAREALYDAAKLRMPRFLGRLGENGEPMRVGPSEKIAELEDFLLATASWRSVLEEARLYMRQATRDLQRKWDHLIGWEENRREGEKSVASIEDAKRITDPDLYDSIQAGEALVRDLSDQIRRLEHDDEVASRAYTLITGS